MPTVVRKRFLILLIFSCAYSVAALHLTLGPALQETVALGGLRGVEPQAHTNEPSEPINCALQNAKAVAVPEGFVEGESAPVRPVRAGFLAPQWSPVNPNQIAFGREGGGLYLLSLDTQKTMRLTDEGGYRFFWTADGRYIVRRVTIPKDESSAQKRKHVIQMINVATAAVTDLSVAESYISLPVQANSGEVVYWTEAGEELAPIPTDVPRKPNWPFAYERNGEIFLRLNGEQERISPAEQGERRRGDPPSHWSPQTSPDGRKVLYEKQLYEGTGLYVYDIETAITSLIGLGQAPSWSPDSKFIAYQQTKDDGHNIRSSSLLIATSDGRLVAELSSGPCPRPMHPSWSPDGKTLTFDCDGGIFIVPCQPK